MGSHVLVYTKKYVYEKLLQRLFCKFKIKTHMCKVNLRGLMPAGPWSTVHEPLPVSCSNVPQLTYC